MWQKLGNLIQTKKKSRDLLSSGREPVENSMGGTPGRTGPVTSSGVILGIVPPPLQLSSAGLGVALIFSTDDRIHL